MQVECACHPIQGFGSLLCLCVRGALHCPQSNRPASLSGNTSHFILLYASIHCFTSRWHTFKPAVRFFSFLFISCLIIHPAGYRTTLSSIWSHVYGHQMNEKVKYSLSLSSLLVCTSLYTIQLLTVSVCPVVSR